MYISRHSLDEHLLNYSEAELNEINGTMKPLSALFIVILISQVVLNLDQKQYNILEKLININQPILDVRNILTDEDIKVLSESVDVNSPGTADEIYDFIVVGSGSAGSVVASRLSEVPQWNVLLLEAGKVENELITIPAIAPVFQLTDYNWKYSLEPQENFGTGLLHQRSPMPRGKALGGSSLLNYMLYTRGDPSDYDRWEAAGNPGWSYKDVLPYFLKSEKANLSYYNPHFHNFNGEWSVEDALQTEIGVSFIKAGEELGFDRVDCNTPWRLGFFRPQECTKQGRRQSTASAFLGHRGYKKNLHIRTSARVLKILINPITNQAYGVIYERKGHLFQAFASKEVILSAGVFNSPQLLMLSGVGPKEHLSEMGIPVVVDLPVGNVYQDHVLFPVPFTSNVTTVEQRSPEDIITEWLRKGTGPLTSSAGTESLGYIKLLDSEKPDVELILLDNSLNSDHGLIAKRILGIRDDVYYPVWGPLEGILTYTIATMLMYPKSSGYVKLRSTDPYDHPLIYGCFLTDPKNEDLRTMIASIRFLLELSETSALQQFGLKLNHIPIPHCAGYLFSSDQYWECAVRTYAQPGYHGVGTCKMGPFSDPTAVVNNVLEVYGTSGLRVVDSSIIPFNIGAHTSAPSAMVGEKAADLIKKHWNIT